ncbi:hypothetical protein DL96DRAFT_1718984 [Flagelloscypha sp. PMI_526]|nr:hypothetical protein DL96DRAFT_1718984 [Flagelloscypha sp. PMI_526]
MFVKTTAEHAATPHSACTSEWTSPVSLPALSSPPRVPTSVRTSPPIAPPPAPAAYPLGSFFDHMLNASLIVPTDAISDSPIWYRKRTPPQQPLPNLPRPPCSPPPTLSSSGCTDIRPPPMARLPSPSPVPGVHSPRPPKQAPSALPLSFLPMSKIQRSSKQRHHRSRSPSVAGSSSNSKPNHSPTLEEVYSPTLLLSPGGFERHDIMIGEGGMQAFVLGVDSPPGDGYESQSSRLRTGPTLPTARDLTSYLSLSGASQDRDPISGLHYGGEEGRRSTGFPTRLNEFGERLSGESAGPSVIVACPSVDSTKSPARHETLKPSVAFSPPRAPAPHASSSTAPPPSTFSRYRLPSVELGLGGPRDFTAADSSFQSSTASMLEYEEMYIGMMEEEAVIVTRERCAEDERWRSLVFSNSPTSPAFSTTSPDFQKSLLTGGYLDAPGSATGAQRESHLLYYLDRMDSPLFPLRDPYSVCRPPLTFSQYQRADNGHSVRRLAIRLPLKSGSPCV